jgi:hypothetical protein
MEFDIFENGLKMQHFSVAEIQNTDRKALERAEIESVLLTAESGSSYVMMSVDNYQQLIERLDRLEDLALARQAQAALSTSKMVGADAFTAEIERLAAIDGNG